MALTAKQEAFCQAIVKGKGPSDAYRSAYNAEKMKPAVIAVKASELLANGKVAVMIELLRKPVMEKVVEKISIDKSWVIEKLVTIVGMGMQAEAVIDNNGEVSGEYKQNLAASNKALELVGKEFGMFVEKKEIKLTSVQEMADEDLDAMIVRKAKEAGVSLH